MVPRVGEKIGPYEILGHIGTGGMGVVFSAWDDRLEREVAIKLLREEFATDDMRSRFLHEARAASALLHPNICIIFDLGEQAGDPFLVMELLHGRTLRDRLQDGDLTVNDLCRVVYDVCDALSLAHSRGIVHRDIKPANLFLVEKPGGRSATKMLDFGLAWMEAMNLTEAGYTDTTVGTASYMSPEQARGEMVDGRSDLFSLGTVLYEMATGWPPFRADSPAATLQALQEQPVRPIRALHPQFPLTVEAIILCLLEKDPARRFQTAAEVMDAIVDVPPDERRARLFRSPAEAPPVAHPEADPAVVPQSSEDPEDILRPVSWTATERGPRPASQVSGSDEESAMPAAPAHEHELPADATRHIRRTGRRPVVRVVVQPDDAVAIEDPEPVVRIASRDSSSKGRSPVSTRWLIVLLLALAFVFAWAVSTFGTGATQHRTQHSSALVHRSARSCGTCAPLANS